jgi:hypothetical protein
LKALSIALGDKKMGNDRVSNPEYYDTRKKYSELYYRFKPKKFYWVMVVLMRKFMISMTSLMFRSNPTFQLAMSLLVMFVFYTLQVLHRPYLTQGEAEKTLQGSKAQMYLTKEQNRRKNASGGRKKQVAYEDIQTKEEAGKFVLGYFWNNNTVEAVLLFSAVLVNLAGLMFAGIPDGVEFYENHKRTITYLLLINVISTVIYYFVVFIWEFLAKTDCAKKLSCCFFFCRKRWNKRKDAGSGHRGSVIDENGIVMAQNPLATRDGSNSAPSAQVSDAVYATLEESQEALRQAQSLITNLRSQLGKYQKAADLGADTSKERKKVGRQKKQFGQGEAVCIVVGGAVCNAVVQRGVCVCVCVCVCVGGPEKSEHEHGFCCCFHPLPSFPQFALSLPLPVPTECLLVQPCSSCGILSCLLTALSLSSTDCHPPVLHPHVLQLVSLKLCSRGRHGGQTAHVSGAEGAAVAPGGRYL